MFSRPNGDAHLALKKLDKYLIGCPRMVWDVQRQPSCNSLITSVDTDCAGCLSTRRSTSGGAAMRGSHLIKHWSLTQGTVTLSSAEAELGGITRGASTSLGLVSIAADLGLTWSLELKTDSTAAIGICRRRGLGKIRHLATADLWVQDRIKAGDFKISKVLGTENVADILTTFTDRATLCKHIRAMGLRQESGRPQLAPNI